MVKLCFYTFLIWLNISGYLSIDQSIITELSEHDLKDYLSTELTKVCSGSNSGTLMITGYNVKFSDFIRSNGKLYDLCPNSSKIETLHLFVLNSLFIDMDLDAEGDELQLTIIAPRWHVFGRRAIHLKGLEGPRLKVPSPADYNADGSPGKPGRPGGNFFGICDYIYKGEHLTVNANGGDGEQGQNGGNGRDNIDVFPLFVHKEDIYEHFKDLGNYEEYRTSLVSTCFEESYDKKIINNYGKKSKFTCKILGEQDYYTPPERIRFYTNPFYYMKQCVEEALICKQYSVKYVPVRENNVVPGAGGSGGKSGLAGSLLMVGLHFPSLIMKMNQPGNKGKTGKGGKGGKDYPISRHLKAVLIKYIDNQKGYINETYYVETPRPLPSPIEHAGGEDGGNSMGIKEPDQPKAVKPYIGLNKYKAYLRESSSDTARTSSILKFHSLLDSNVVLTNFYDTTGFIDELKGIEDHFHKLNKDVDFNPFYKSLLHRIAEYVDKHHKDVNLQSKKVLAYAYSAILGKISILKESFESVLVTDIIIYMQMTKKKFDELKPTVELKFIVDKLNNIKQLKSQYNDLVQNKMDIAHSLIQKDVMPDIQTIGEGLNNTLSYLIKEINQHLRKALEEEENLNESKVEARKQLVIKLTLNVLKVAGSLLTLFGKTFAIAGIAIYAAASLGKMALTKEIIIPDVEKLPIAVEKLNDTILSFRSRETARLTKQLDDVLNMTKSYSGTLNSFRSEINEMKTTLARSNSMVEIKAVEKNFRILVRQKYKELSGFESEENSNFLAQVGLRRVNMLNQRARQKKKKNRDSSKETDKAQEEKDASAVLGAIDLGLDLFTDLSNDLKTIETINNVLVIVREKIKKLNKYLEAVYDVLCPLLDDLAHTLGKVSHNLQNLSPVALIITEYKMKKTLDSIIEFIRYFTEGFKVQGKFLNLLNNVQGTFGVLINAYKQIQDYVRELTLSNHIADLVSTAANDIRITDSYYVETTNELAISISSNIVLMHYQYALNAFKQYVFPFAHKYFAELILPKHLQFEKNLEDFVLKAEYQTNNLLNKLEVYKSTVSSNDGTIGTTVFNSFRRSTRPFFVWKNEQHRAMISKLLSGEEVLAYADVTESVSFKDVIKFSEIAIYFTAKNKTTQSKINECLEAFKISLIHLGNSYYRYNSKIYLLTSPSLEIWFSFDSENGEPLDKSESYDKIKQGSYMLSPYALWKLQIMKIHEETSFDELKVYKNYVDLELGGKGRYIENRKISRLQLNEDLYYEPLGANKSF